LGILSSRGTYSGIYKGEKRAYHQVRISRAFFDSFKFNIGFVQKRKHAALAAMPKPRQNCAKRLSMWEDTVKIVEDLRVDIPMIDLEVEGGHVFLANGILTHNSQGLTLDRIQVDLRHSFLGSPAMCYGACSRCRTADGLHLVGDPAMVERRCKTDPAVLRWL